MTATSFGDCENILKQGSVRVHFSKLREENSGEPAETAFDRKMFLALGIASKIEVSLIRCFAHIS